jgi:hypothetical protein
VRVILYARPEWLTSAASVARTASERTTWPDDNLVLYEKGDQQFAVKRNPASLTVRHMGDSF